MTREQITFDALLFPGRKTLRAQECADALGCSVRHIYDLVDEGVLRAIDISGMGNLSDRRFIRIPADAWHAFLSARTV